jgi:ABC-type nitrate/sulfonate/bicarbonate transport system substrate-binding protein
LTYINGKNWLRDQHQPFDGRDTGCPRKLQEGYLMRNTFVALLLILGLAACDKFSPPTTERRSGEPLEKITVAYTYQPQSSLVHIAVAKGYFVEEGLDVRSLMFTFGKAALQSVIEDKADFGTVAETPVMFSVLKGETIFVIANIEASTMNNGIVARRDAGISTPGDLLGKRIAFTPGTTSDFYLDSLLTANGLTRKQIHPVALKPDEMEAAILAKVVDAISIWNYPLTQIKRKLGPNGLTFYDREIYTETFNIAARQDFVRKNPETVKRFLRALIKAESFVAKDPDEAQAIMSSATKIDKDVIREIWSSFHYHVGFDQTLLITLEDETRWAMKNRLTDNAAMPNYLEFIYLDGLAAVKPEAIKMGR